MSHFTLRTWHLWLLAAAILVAVACTVERADVRTPSGEPPEADSTAVRRLLEAIAVAFSTGDVASLDTIYDENVTVFDGGRAEAGWLAYREGHLAPELASLSERRLRFEDVRVRLAGSTAWAICRYTLTGVRDGEQVAAEGLGTMVFRKFLGRWRLVHSHTSSGGEGRR